MRPGATEGLTCREPKSKPFAALLSSKPRPVGWEERRRRIEEVGAAWPVADDVKLEAVDLDGVKGEWSIVPGADPSRLLIYFHGGGYCFGFDCQPPPIGDRGRTGRGPCARWPPRTVCPPSTRFRPPETMR